MDTITLNTALALTDKIYSIENYTILAYPDDYDCSLEIISKDGGAIHILEDLVDIARACHACIYVSTQWDTNFPMIRIF